MTVCEDKHGTSLKLSNMEGWNKPVKLPVGMKIEGLSESDKSNLESIGIDITKEYWVIDRNPKEVSIEWIRENAFQLIFSEHTKEQISNKKE